MKNHNTGSKHSKYHKIWEVYLPQINDAILQRPQTVKLNDQAFEQHTQRVNKNFKLVYEKGTISNSENHAMRRSLITQLENPTLKSTIRSIHHLKFTLKDFILIIE